jgi:hypothetical protein
LSSFIIIVVKITIITMITFVIIFPIISIIILTIRWSVEVATSSQAAPTFSNSAAALELSRWK